MKKSLLISALMATFTILTPSTFAADGTVNFTGSIIDNACIVDIGPGNTLTVPLGKISATSFTAAGTTSAATKFTLKLRTCPSNTTATVKFDGVTSGDNKILALTESPDMAKGLGIQISDKDGTIVPIAGNSGNYPLEKGEAEADVTNNLDFIARYIATAETVTAGRADATASFTINYN